MSTPLSTPRVLSGHTQPTETNQILSLSAGTTDRQLNLVRPLGPPTVPPRAYFPPKKAFRGPKPKPFPLRENFLIREAKKQMEQQAAAAVAMQQAVAGAQQSVDGVEKKEGEGEVKELVEIKKVKDLEVNEVDEAKAVKENRKKLKKPVGLWVDTGVAAGKKMEEKVMMQTKKVEREHEEKEIPRKVNWACGFCGPDCFCGGDDDDE